MTIAIYPVLPGLTFTVVKTPDFDTLVNRAPNAYEVRIAQTINPTWTWTLIYEFLHDFPWAPFTSVSELRTLMGFFLQAGGKAASFLFSDPDDNFVGPAIVTTSWAANTFYALGSSIIDAADHWQQITSAGMSGATIPTFNDSGGVTVDNGAQWTDRGSFPSGYPNTPLAQLALVNDGAGNYYSPIQRTLDGIFYEDVTDLQPIGGIPINVCANGALTTNYTLEGPGLALPTASYMGMYLKWNAAPTPPITAQFNFYFRVRFESDSQDFEKFLGIGTSIAQTTSGPYWHAGGYWTIGGSEAQNGTGTLKLTTARPTPL